MNKNPSVRRTTVVGVIGIVLAVTVACSATTRYRTLSFFFDGVPNPEAKATDESKPREVSDFRRMIESLPERETPAPAAPIPVSVHAPVRDRQCNQCHNMGTAMTSPAMDVGLCDRCHAEQRLQAGWNHGPINFGTCVPCHQAHDSPYPHLLAEAVPDLCRQCHVEDSTLKEIHEDVPEESLCTDCHEPHRVEI